MFSLSDLKPTRVYQEALQEGIQLGKQEEKHPIALQIIPRYLTLG